MKPTAAQVKAEWESTVKPNCRKVAEALTKKGLEISFKTVNVYQNNKWAEPKTSPLKKAATQIAKVKAKPVKEVKVKEPPKHIDEVAVPEAYRNRVAELLLCSVAENQARLQNTGLITAILVAEELAALIGKLTLDAPGDVARLLHAITEASQVRHVGGAGQPPTADDPRVIEGEVVKNEVSDAIDRFRKNAGLT